MKQKQKILLILIGMALVACAVFLPSVIWKGHIHRLSNKQITRDYDLTRTDAVLTTQMVLDNLGTYEPYPGTQFQTEEEQMWQEIHTALSLFLEHTDPDTQEYINDIVDRSYLELFTETPIIRQGEHGTVYMILTVANMICTDDNIQIFLYYEKKTKLILTLEVMTTEKDGAVKNVDVLGAAAHSYCEERGITENNYQCFVNPEAFFLQMITDNTQYGTAEKE